jgi:hypothetical protein
MNKVDTARWAGVADSLSRSLNSDHDFWSLRPRAERNAALVPVRPASDLAYIETVLGARMRGNAALAGISVELGEERLSIVLPETLAPQTVAALAILLGNFGNAVSVRAFGRDGRIAAMERATELSQALRNAGLDREVPAMGLAGVRRLEIAVREGRTAP